MNAPPVTPDGRYLMVRGRLWRKTNPHLSDARRAQLVRALMVARRMLGQPGGSLPMRARARHAVQSIKEWLGERGPVWWHDGAPDYGRKMARNTPYAAWAQGVLSAETGALETARLERLRRRA